MPESFALQLLDSLEEHECELLVWGFVDGGFTRGQLEELAHEVADKQSEYVSHEDLISFLEDHRLIFSFPVGGEQLYRTRFAEAIRLFFHLKQIFRPEQWAVAPRLVADYRLEIQARRYPRRYIDSDQVVRRIESVRKLSVAEKESLDALLAPPGQDALTLSDFQARATEYLLGHLNGPSNGGMIVCTGTGSGKTLAFYLPCLMKVIELMSKDVYWTQIVAIYPRNVLLTDQFTEAYRQARYLDGVSTRHKGRKVRIGAYFGPTPNRKRIEDVQFREWERQGKDFTCPYITCPQCGADMIWRREDIVNGCGVLVCSSAKCAHHILEDEVLLTRDSMQDEPPDILFTTTEMLNRELSSSWSRHLFGVDLSYGRSPYAMLLDEAHAYGDTHGAQVAILIRRWRAMVKRPVQFVGLSATLTDPQGFFAQLVGLQPGAVTAIGEGQDIEEHAKEYHLVLRGDPVSGASLLSTSIQAAMLLGRVLDPVGSSISSDVYATRVFLFTDDLDVTNRLYHNLLDAEARDSRGNARTDREPLASLRSSEQPDLDKRFLSGQAWRLCEMIGHPLNPPEHRLAIGRTSSQDVGVDSKSNIVVATSSLEVGYNDPTVGAVLQHKAPKDSASFLQRRGRAGRRRTTRPWTVVVVSDYGRDRLAYQAYERLFNPVLDRPTLPVRNRYVLKMQAVYAFIDWITTQLPGHPRGRTWYDFAGPAKDEYQKQRQQSAMQLIKELLASSTLRDRLTEYLCRALSIEDIEAEALLWEPPRALMTAVLPTLLRRMSTGWSKVVTSPLESCTDYQVRSVPLPDFVPENLFSDLSLPEVRINTPRHQSTETDTWSLPITQALNTVAPGRVTRRFGVRHIQSSHWVAPPSLHTTRQQMAVQDFCVQYEDLGDFQIATGQAHTAVNVRCIRPWTVNMTQIPSDKILATSNAFLDWRTQIYYQVEGDTYSVPPNLRLGELVTSVRFFTQNMRRPIRVRRFAVGSSASIRFKDGGESRVYAGFIDDDTGAQAAIGFEQEVDGVSFTCSISDEYRNRILQGDGLRSCRCPFFIHRVVTDEILAPYANAFRLEWMAQVYLSLILEVAVRERGSLEEAVRVCHQDDMSSQVEHVLHSIFQVVAGEPQEEGSADDERRALRARGHREISALFGDADICSRLRELSAVLWESPDSVFHDWLTRRLTATLGGALLQACHQIAPEYQLGSLYLDLDGGARMLDCERKALDEGSIWITESMIGGGGVVEEIARCYAEDPRRFFLLVEAALDLSDFELVDSELTRIVELTQSDQDIARVFTAIRNAGNNEELRESQRALMHTLGHHNVQTTHSVLLSLNARVLRAGSSPQSDALLRDMMAFWSTEEDRLGVEVDARVFAYVASSIDRFSTQLHSALHAVGGNREGQLSEYSTLYGLLWPRGSMVRERSLASYNPYCDMPQADPKLIRDELGQRVSAVEVEGGSWQASIRQALAEYGIGRLSCSADHRSLLRSAILELCTQPIEADFLYLYPYVAQIQRTHGKIVATLSLREALQ